MNYGFVRVAAATPKIKVGDCGYNRSRIEEKIEELREKQVQIAVLPELCLTGYTCSDLFWQTLLIENAKKELKALADFTKGIPMLIFVGLPLETEGKLFNVAAAICDGRVLGFVPKTHLPNYGEFYEKRHFTSGACLEETSGTETDFFGEKIPVSRRLIFTCREMPQLAAAAEICEDLWAPNPPGVEHALHGATLLVNLSASDEVVGKDSYRRDLVKGQSARLVCGYVYASAGEGESTTDLVFGGHNLIAENGTLLGESRLFTGETVIRDMDMDRIRNERRRMTTFRQENRHPYRNIEFSLEEREENLIREISMTPFVPADSKNRAYRCEEILNIQTMGLKKRLEHTGSQHAAVGISGGLDSTLALLVTARAFDSLGLPRQNILSVTMPGFGTTGRTYANAAAMSSLLGATLKEIDIQEPVRLHFRQIGHDEKKKDVTYENAQARQRTYLLMDLANQEGALVIGTGDMSELALGWTTYNADHMSMYGVNAGVPKTLVRHLVRYCADTASDPKLKEILYDILDTPVSPELLPPGEDGGIAQKTEDLVGPYELHDFFLYYMLRMGYEPGKILYLAKHAFAGVYGEETILKWLKTFYRRYFSQQFKRSCLPDGPKVGSVAVSPRGDLRMPSDAVVREWLKALE